MAPVRGDGSIGGVAVLQSQPKSLEKAFDLCLDFGPFSDGLVDERRDIRPDPRGEYPVGRASINPFVVFKQLAEESALTFLTVSARS